MAQENQPQQTHKGTDYMPDLSFLIKEDIAKRDKRAAELKKSEAVNTGSPETTSQLDQTPQSPRRNILQRLLPGKKS